MSPAGSPSAVLHDIDWRLYSRLLRAFEPRRGFRLTYDRGTLEIRSPLWECEEPSKERREGEPMSTAAPPAGPLPAVLYDVDWHTYTRLLRAFEASKRRFRLTYDRGTLEIMSPLLWEHEAPSALLGLFITTLAEELNLPCRLGGSTTLRRRRKRRGVEPDNCYWIASAPLLQGKRELDLRVDPQPDLAVEVDVTSSSLDRLSIYAVLGVPEVWCFSSGGIAFHILEAGAYQVRPNSLSFPQLASTDLIPFLAQWGQTDDTAIVRQFRAWVRQQMLQRPTSPPPP
jgi:Uma2 family endonuclease